MPTNKHMKKAFLAVGRTVVTIVPSDVPTTDSTMIIPTRVTITTIDLMKQQSKRRGHTAPALASQSRAVANPERRVTQLFYSPRSLERVREIKVVENKRRCSALM